MRGQGTAVVTGASAGIGACFARRLAARGYDLVLVARRASRLADLAAELAGTVTVEPLVADLADPAGVAAVADRVSGSDISLLVNNAGINGYGRFLEVHPDVLEAVVALNVVAPTRLARVALPGLVDRGRGAVVNVSSLLAFSGSRTDERLPRRATYAGTKSYLAAFTRLLAAEVAGSGVTVQLLLPGYTATEFHARRDGRPVDDNALAGVRRADPRAMAADDVVVASLAALDRGESVCAPGLEDIAAVDRLAAAETAMLAGNQPRLAARYTAD